MKIKVHDLKEEVKEQEEENWEGLFIYTNDEGQKTIVLGVGSSGHSSLFSGIELYSNVRGVSEYLLENGWDKTLYERYNKPLTVTFEND